MSNLQAWAEDHVGIDVEIAGAPWCLEGVRHGRAILREETPLGVSTADARIRVMDLSTVYRRYLRQNCEAS